MTAENALSERPIGLFDSGLGGLTILQSLRQNLPCENFIYFGDTARVPYGGQTREAIIRYSIENSIFLLEKNIKLLVVACNTASVYSTDKLRQLFSIPVIDVLEAGVESAVQASKNKRIAVLGTNGTIASGAFQAGIKVRYPYAEVLSIACPLFVPLIEEGFVDHPSARLIVKEYLKPLQHARVDTLLLGCTHYSLLKHLIQAEVGESLSIVDSSRICAEKVSQVLTQMQTHCKGAVGGHSRYFVSDDPEKFCVRAQACLGESIADIESTSPLYTKA